MVVLQMLSNLHATRPLVDAMHLFFHIMASIPPPPPHFLKCNRPILSRLCCLCYKIQGYYLLDFCFLLFYTTNPICSHRECFYYLLSIAIHSFSGVGTEGAGGGGQGPLNHKIGGASPPPQSNVHTTYLWYDMVRNS